MLEIALKMINKINDSGYEAYIVGGFVRDYLMGKKSNDIDITTNARPKELVDIFPTAEIDNVDYGSVTVFFKDIRFEITTYRVEENYSDNRHPDTIRYINDIDKDLKRRDFTINTICIDKDGNVYDKMNGQADIHKKVIRTVIDPVTSFTLDALRILRAVRFATTLGFELDSQIIMAISLTRHLLNDLSINRKKEELNKIFGSANLKRGLKLIKDLKLVDVLKLKNIDNVKNCSQVIGVWTALEVDDIYPFTRNELKLMKDIREVVKNNPLSFAMLYKYDLYVCSVAAELLEISKKEVANTYSKMPIHKRSDIVIDTYDIIDYLKIEEGPILSEIWNGLEQAILNFEVSNDKKQLLLLARKIYTSLDN